MLGAVIVITRPEHKKNVVMTLFGGGYLSIGKLWNIWKGAIELAKILSTCPICKTYKTNMVWPLLLLSMAVFQFNVYGSVHRKYIPKHIQHDATLRNLFISWNCSTCFGWYLHPSSGAQRTVSTASGICQTVTATCRYSRR
jgi:hypothetical protein